MGDTAMEGKVLKSQVALFVGIRVTYQSLIAGYFRHKYWFLTMQAFRNVNVRFKRGVSLPEELVLQIQGYLKEEGKRIWGDGSKRSKSWPRERSPDIDHCVEKTISPYLLENFSVASLTGGFHSLPMSSVQLSHAYICIPWGMDYEFGPEDAPERITNGKLVTGQGFHQNDKHWALEFEYCFVEQDLTITPEKTLALNAVIRELDLMVLSSDDDIRQVDFQTRSKRHGLTWPYTISSEWDREFWTPRVIMTNRIQRVLEDGRSS